MNYAAYETEHKYLFAPPRGLSERGKQTLP